MSADVTQEVASRGMGLVYDMSESSQKEALVGMLVGTLLEGRKYACPYSIVMHACTYILLTFMSTSYNYMQ